MSDNSTNSVVALLTGAAVGAVFGILYAPQSGKDTREQLREEAFKAKDKIGDQYDELSSQVTEYAHTARNNFENKVGKLFNKASDQADDILAGMEKELATLRKKNQELVKELDKLKG